MIKLKHLTPGIVALSLMPFAAQAKTFAGLVNETIVPLGDKLVELIYALSFVFFLVGMVRYFFSHSAEGRQQGKYFAIYGIAALVVLFVVWGLVRFLLGILNSFNT